MKDPASTVVTMIANSGEAAPPLSSLVAQFPVGTREGLTTVLNHLQGEVLVVWINPLDEPEVGPRITLTPEGAERYGLRLDDNSQIWVPAHVRYPEQRTRRRRREISLTDFTSAHASAANGTDRTAKFLASIPDPKAYDPSNVMFGSDESEGPARHPQRKGPRSSLHSGNGLQPPTLVLMGCQAWPPRPFEGSRWKCQICRDLPLSLRQECAWCDRGGQDAQIPKAISAQVRRSRQGKSEYARSRLRGGKER
jgi:hypothetical protein